MKLALVVTLLVSVTPGCSITQPAPPGQPMLADGAYPVVGRDHPHALAIESLPRGGDAPETHWILATSLLRFRDVPRHEFEFNERGHCTRVVLPNSEALRSYSRSPVGSRIAIVVGGRVISSHKLRGPLEGETVEVTFCPEDSGDHVHRHLKTVLLAPKS